MGFFTIFDDRVRYGLEKLHYLIFDDHLDAMDKFDTWLLYTFVALFMGFLIAAIFTVFEEKQRSLQEIKFKVNFSKATLAELATALWTIREANYRSITHEGYLAILHAKSSMARMLGKDEEVKDVAATESIAIESAGDTTKAKDECNNKNTPNKPVRCQPKRKASFLPKLGRSQSRATVKSRSTCGSST